MLSILFILLMRRINNKYKDRYGIGFRGVQLYQSAPEWHEETANGLSIRGLSKKGVL